MIKYIFLFTLLAVLIPTVTFAEQYDVCDGVRYINLFYDVYDHTFSKTKGDKKSTVHILLVDLNKVTVEPVIAPGGRMNQKTGHRVYPKKIAYKIADAASKRRQAVAAVNGGFFEIRGLVSHNYSKFKGRNDNLLSVHSSWWLSDTRPHVKARRELRIFENRDGKQRAQIAAPGDRNLYTTSILMIVGGGGLLLPFVDARDEPRLKRDTDPNRIKARTAVGYVDTKPNCIVIAVVKDDKGASIYQLSRLMSRLLDLVARQSVPDNQKHAMAMDGGGSSQLYIKPDNSGWITKQCGRKVITALSVYSHSERRWYLIVDQGSRDPAKPRLIITEVKKGNSAPQGKRYGPFDSEDEARKIQQEIYRRYDW